MGTGSTSGNETVKVAGFDPGFEELISQCSGPVYRLCLNVSQSHSESERVLNDVFSQALTEIASLTSEQESLTRAMLRSAIARMAEREELREGGTKTLPTLPGVADLRATIGEILSTLPYEYRVVYALREVLDLSIPETAEVLGISEVEARAYLHRARLVVFREVRRRREIAANDAPPADVALGDELIN